MCRIYVEALRFSLDGSKTQKIKDRWQQESNRKTWPFACFRGTQSLKIVFCVEGRNPRCFRGDRDPNCFSTAFVCSGAKDRGELIASLPISSTPSVVFIIPSRVVVSELTSYSYHRKDQVSRYKQNPKDRDVHSYCVPDDRSIQEIWGESPTSVTLLTCGYLFPESPSLFDHAQAERHADPVNTRSNTAWSAEVCMQMQSAVRKVAM